MRAGPRRRAHGRGKAAAGPGARGRADLWEERSGVPAADSGARVVFHVGCRRDERTRRRRWGGYPRMRAADVVS